MAKISLRQKHKESRDDARRKVDEAIAPHVRKFGLKKEWKGDKLFVKGKGVTGTLSVGDSDVDIDMKLGLPASMVSSQIENELKNQLKKSFENA